MGSDVQDVERQLERKMAQLAVLREIGRAINAAWELEATLELITRRTAGVMSTEVSVPLFDLLDRVYGYPLEVTIEALAPTAERDFELLPSEKQRLYKAVQTTHVHASPDGPWFFIIARSRPEEGQWQLLGITDTSMLRPQVFALHEGKVQIGLIASEKQAIDAALESLATQDERICPVADRYWNARGGSHTDGGAFLFTW
jgi:hypothetical protein